MIKEMGFSGENFSKNWPYSLSTRLVDNGYISEAQKFQLKLFNNIENLVDIYSKVDKYVLTQSVSRNLEIENNGFFVLNYLAKNRAPFRPEFFFKNINITHKYTVSFCTKKNLDDYLALGNFSENPDDDWLYKIGFFNDAKIIKKNKYSLLLKNGKYILLFIYWNGKYLDMNIYYEGNNKKVLKDIQKFNSCRIVRIFSKYGDLFDIRVENHRKFLPETGDLYMEAEQDFNVLKTNMCI